MLKIKPTGLWRWDFQITGLLKGLALNRLNTTKETGQIEYGGHVYPIEREEKSPQWQWRVLADGVPYAQAKRVAVLMTAYEITGPEGVLLWQCPGPFTRAFNLKQNEKILGTLKPDHSFTRHASVDFSPEISELTQLFCIWLATKHWSDSSGD